MSENKTMTCDRSCTPVGGSMLLKFFQIFHFQNVGIEHFVCMLPASIVKEHPVEHISQLELQLKVLQASSLLDKMTQNHPSADEDCRVEADYEHTDPRVLQYKAKYFQLLTEHSLNHHARPLRQIREVSCFLIFGEGFSAVEFSKYSNFSNIRIFQIFEFSKYSNSPNIRILPKLFFFFFFFFWKSFEKIDWEPAESDIEGQVLMFQSFIEALWILCELTICQSETTSTGKVRVPFVPKDILRASFAQYLPDGV